VARTVEISPGEHRMTLSEASGSINCQSARLLGLFRREVNSLLPFAVYSAR